MKIGELNTLLNELNELESKEFLSPSEKKEKKEIEDIEVYVYRQCRASMMHTPLGGFVNTRMSTLSKGYEERRKEKERD